MPNNVVTCVATYGAFRFMTRIKKSARVMKLQLYLSHGEAGVSECTVVCSEKKSCQ